MRTDPDLLRDSPGWRLFALVSFALSLVAMGVGIYALPVEGWVRGYVAMGTLFLTGSTFTLAKTLRDDHEAKKWLNRVHDARTEQMLQDLEATGAAK